MFGRHNCGSFEGEHPFSFYGHFFNKSAFKDIPREFMKWKCGKHEHFRQNRETFTQEEFNILILSFLNEKPSYGFEIIKLIEEISEGTLTPKPESVYPALTNLEDLGYAKITTEENGKRIYSITESGKIYLDENKEILEKVLKTLSELKEEISSKTISDIYQVLKNIGFTIFEKHREKGWTNQQLKDLVKILERTASEIKGL